MNRISFFTEEIDFNLLGEDPVRDWILSYVSVNGRLIGSINYIFVDDERMLALNNELLDHDFYTDIITVPLELDPQKPLSSDIFISITRVEDNARRMTIPFWDELHRVMIHGMLHLMGFRDYTDEEKQEMRELESVALSLRGEDVPRGTKN